MNARSTPLLPACCTASLPLYNRTQLCRTMSYASWIPARLPCVKCSREIKLKVQSFRVAQMFLRRKLRRNAYPKMKRVFRSNGGGPAGDFFEGG